MNKILRSVRRRQLEKSNQEAALVVELRALYPTDAQPYPIFWPRGMPAPELPCDKFTMAEDIRFDLDLVRGPMGLPGSYLIAVSKIPEGWSAGLDENGVPTIPYPLDISLCHVIRYDPRNGYLALNLGPNPDQILPHNLLAFDPAHIMRAVQGFKKYWEYQLDYGEELGTIWAG